MRGSEGAATGESDVGGGVAPASRGASVGGSSGATGGNATRVKAHGNLRIWKLCVNFRDLVGANIAVGAASPEEENPSAIFPQCGGSLFMLARFLARVGGRRKQCENSQNRSNGFSSGFKQTHHVLAVLGFVFGERQIATQRKGRLFGAANQLRAAAMPLNSAVALGHRRPKCASECRSGQAQFQSGAGDGD